MKAPGRGRRCGLSKEQQQYHQARKSYTKALSKGFASIYKRFLTDETYCESQSKVQWTEELCLNLDQLAQEDRSYVATRPERERYDNMWVFRQLPSEDDHEIRSETFSPPQLTQS